MPHLINRTIEDVDKAIAAASKLDSRDVDKLREMRNTIDGLLDERMRLMKERDSPTPVPPLTIKTYIT